MPSQANVQAAVQGRSEQVSASTPPAGLTRHIDCLGGDLNGWLEAQAEGARNCEASIAILKREIAKAERNQAAGFGGVYVPPGNWGAIEDEGAACFYDGECEIAAQSWQLDANDPELWAKIERAAALV